MAYNHQKFLLADFHRSQVHIFHNFDLPYCVHSSKKNQKNIDEGIKIIVFSIFAALNKKLLTPQRNVNGSQVAA